LKTALVIWLLSLLPCLSLGQQETPKRPNIILILLDDLGFSDFGCYGSEIRTPNIDRLAARGIRFTQFYSAAKCIPTRTSVLTGLYWQSAGLGIQRGLTLGEAMRAAQYTTIAVGKWHLLGSPEQRGFDRAFGHLSGATSYFKGDETFHLDGKPFSVPAEGFYTTDADTDFAIQFINEQRQKSPSQPFFMYLAYNAPHAPLQAWPSDIAKYRGLYRKGWDQLRQERYQRQREMALIKTRWKLSPRPTTIPAWQTLTEREQDFEDLRMAVYAAMVDRVDQNVGRLVAKLKEWKLEENTLILLLSDNGGNPFERHREGEPGTPNSYWSYGIGWANLSDTPFRLYKRNQHEGGIATPLIAYWPAGIKNPGAIVDQPGHVIDLMPTCLRLARWEYPATFAGQVLPPLSGRSLLPVFEGKTRPRTDTLYFQLFDDRALIAGNWKLESAHKEPWELYRIDQDRTETHDLAPAYPEKVKEMERLWQSWWTKQYQQTLESAGTPPVYVPLCDFAGTDDPSGEKHHP
jgi:arylsulfatase A-like enzyme